MVKETNIKKDNFEIEELTFGRKKISLSTFKNKHKNLITKNNSNTSGFDSLNLTTFIDEKNPNTIEYSLGNCKARISYIMDSNKKLNNIEIKNEEIKFSDGFYNFEYKKTKNGIKELIYINNRCEEYVFKYNVKLDNLKIEKKNNHIIFKSVDLNKTIFTLIAPFLYDSSHNFSHKVNIDICNIGNEEYELVYTYDKKRINSDERNFPIIIDPTISVNEESSEIYQLIYNESTGNWEEDLNQSSYFYIDATYRVGIYIDISQLNLSGRKITSAYLNLDFSDAGNFLVNNNLLYIDNEATIDVTDMIQNDQDVDVVIAKKRKT